MKKKTITFLSILAFALIFSTSYCFANNNIAQDAVDGVRNFVGGAENVLEGAANGITNGLRNGVNATGNVVSDMTGTNHNRNGALTSDNNGDNYTATRTATTRSVATANTDTFLGMGATAWGWFIMAAFGIITIGLVWYYGKQHEYRSNYDDNNY